MSACVLYVTSADGIRAGLQDAEFRTACQTIAHVTSSAKNGVMERADSAAGSPAALRPVIRAELQDAGFRRASKTMDSVPYYGVRASAASLKPGSRILARFQFIVYHNELAYKLEHWMFERIVLWQVNGNAPLFFVATPDCELCLEPYEWWMEVWALVGGRYPPRAHNFGCDIVHTLSRCDQYQETH